MYRNKTVLITGHSRGIGKMLCDHFQVHGARVIGLSRDEVDLSKPEDIEHQFRILSEMYSNIDILVVNAAVLTSQYSTKMSIKDAQAMVNTNLVGAFMVIREGIKLMFKSKSKYGRIVSISSMAVALELQGDSLYAATKAGLTTMSNIMAKEYAFMNITVNTLAISAIETDMLRQLKKEKIDEVVKSLPIPRYATKEDITNVVDFYCSEKSSYITGQTIYLGGVHK